MQANRAHTLPTGSRLEIQQRINEQFRHTVNFSPDPSSLHRKPIYENVAATTSWSSSDKCKKLSEDNSKAQEDSGVDTSQSTKCASCNRVTQRRASEPAPNVKDLHTYLSSLSPQSVKELQAIVQSLPQGGTEGDSGVQAKTKPKIPPKPKEGPLQKQSDDEKSCDSQREQTEIEITRPENDRFILKSRSSVKNRISGARNMFQNLASSTIDLGKGGLPVPTKMGSDRNNNPSLGTSKSENDLLLSPIHVIPKDKLANSSNQKSECAGSPNSRSPKSPRRTRFKQVSYEDRKACIIEVLQIGQGKEASNTKAGSALSSNPVEEGNISAGATAAPEPQANLTVIQSHEKENKACGSSRRPNESSTSGIKVSVYCDKMNYHN